VQHGSQCGYQWGIIGPILLPPAPKPSRAGNMAPDLSLAALRRRLTPGPGEVPSLTPTQLLRELHPRLAGACGVFIHLEPLEALLERCAALEAQPRAERGPMWGVPFAVKDNVDVAGLPTTAACPAFSYTPKASAPAVDALLAAGGLESHELMRAGGGGAGGLVRSTGRCGSWPRASHQT
jgi:hypothetical protein